MRETNKVATLSLRFINAVSQLPLWYPTTSEVICINQTDVNLIREEFWPAVQVKLRTAHTSMNPTAFDAITYTSQVCAFFLIITSHFDIYESLAHMATS